MSETDYVTQKDFKSAIAYLLLRHQEHVEMLTVMSALLVAKGTINMEEFQKAMMDAANHQRSQSMRETVAKLGESVIIQEILKQVDGPIQ